MTRDSYNLAPLPPVIGESNFRVIRAVTHLASRAINAFLDKTEANQVSAVSDTIEDHNNPLQTP